MQTNVAELAKYFQEVTDGKEEFMTELNGSGFWNCKAPK